MQICGRSCRRSSTFCPPAANGEPCHASFRRIRRCRVIFIPGATLAGGIGSSGLWCGRRRRLGRKPKPTAAMIDSQSASTTQAGGPRGYDPGKRVHGRKRHIVIDTNGLLLAVHVHPANVQDVHDAVPLLERVRHRFRSCGMSLPTGFIAARSLSMRSPIVARGRSRSSSDRRRSKASSSCRGVGWSNVPSRGSDAAASPETSRAPLPPRSLGCSLPMSGS